jgi:hypothetical protein
LRHPPRQAHGQACAPSGPMVYLPAGGHRGGSRPGGRG